MVSNIWEKPVWCVFGVFYLGFIAKRLWKAFRKLYYVYKELGENRLIVGLRGWNQGDWGGETKVIEVNIYNMYIPTTVLSNYMHLWWLLYHDGMRTFNELIYCTYLHLKCSATVPINKAQSCSLMDFDILIVICLKNNELCHSVKLRHMQIALF